LSLDSVKTLGLIPNSKKQQQSRIQKKLHVILVGAMGTIYKDYTDKSLADLNLDFTMRLKN